jgi:hypothetical protein
MLYRYLSQSGFELRCLLELGMIFGESIKSLTFGRKKRRGMMQHFCQKLQLRLLPICTMRRVSLYLLFYILLLLMNITLQKPQPDISGMKTFYPSSQNEINFSIPNFASKH